MKTKSFIQKLFPLVLLFFGHNVFGAVNLSTATLRQDSVKSMLVGSMLRTVFYVYAPESTTYNFDFWVMGTRLSGGQISTYEVGVDGETRGYIRPSRADWCRCSPYSMADTYLTAGEHQIYLQAFYADLPNAEKILPHNISTYPTNYSDSSRYEKIKNHYYPQPIIGYVINPITFTDYRQFSFNAVGNDDLVPPLYYTAELNKSVYYTFHRLEYYEAGQTVTINLSSAGSFQKIIHVFSQDGESFSATSPAIPGTSGAFSCTIPTDGLYYVLVRSYDPADWGVCDVTISNGVYSRSFDSVPVNCSRTAITSPESNKEYACFALSKDSDPVVYLMSSGYGGGVLGFNDDFSSTQSNFDWGTNARLDGGLSNGQWLFTLTKSYPGTSLPQCDIYTRCEKADYVDSDFPNYGLDDCLYSSTSIGNYNSLSWALKEWLFPYVFPLEDGNEYIDSVMSAYSYGVVNANKASVDQWAVQDSDGNYMTTHFSVLAKSHDYAGGYAWESKLDNGVRLFHPRYDLQGEVFGTVIKSWGEVFNIIPGPFEPILYNASPSQDETNQIQAGLRDIPQANVKEFLELYEKCQKEGTKKVSIFIDSYERMKSYKPLLDYCSKHPALEYLLYQKTCESDMLAIKLLKDLTLQGTRSSLWKQAIENVRNMCSERKDRKCLHNAQSYGMTLVKLLLADEVNKPFMVQGASFSDDPVLTVKSSGRHLTISFDLEADAIVSVYAGNTEGTLIKAIAEKRKLERGSYTYEYLAPRKGTYIVGLTVNGAVYKKTLHII